MRHLRSLGVLACMSLGMSACSGSHGLMLDDSVPPGLRDEADRVRDAGPGDVGAPAPDRPAPTTDSGPVIGPPSQDQPDPPPTTGVAGAGVPVAGAGGSFMPPPPPSGGTGGRSAPPIDPSNPRASDVLNPQRCATDEPFVLSIDPDGASGEVRGWLESAPSVSFDANDLPRFGTPTDPMGDPAGDLTLWWSISSLDGDDPSLWFYAANAATQVTYVPVASLAEIGDPRAYMYTDWAVGPVRVGEFAVFRHIPSERYIAVQVLDLYGTEDSDRRDTCAAVEARWFVASPETGDFSAFAGRGDGIE